MSPWPLFESFQGASDLSLLGAVDAPEHQSRGWEIIVADG